MKNKYFLLLASLVLNLVLVWALIWGGQGLVAYRSLKDEMDVLAERNKELAEKNIRLSREIKLLESDDKYIEQMIRKRLNFIKDNELWYIFSGPKGTKGANETED